MNKTKKKRAPPFLIFMICGIILLTALGVIIQCAGKKKPVPAPQPEPEYGLTFDVESIIA